MLGLQHEVNTACHVSYASHVTLQFTARFLLPSFRLFFLRTLVALSTAFGCARLIDFRIAQLTSHILFCFFNGCSTVAVVMQRCIACRVPAGAQVRILPRATVFLVRGLHKRMSESASEAIDSSEGTARRDRAPGVTGEGAPARAQPSGQRPQGGSARGVTMVTIAGARV